MILNGKVAIVTGAGRRLGRAAALAMARAGEGLVIVSRTARELEETASIWMACEKQWRLRGIWTGRK
jgi:NAD(P)-dependent dehydrogenase (short-subunit alcohol dehydrogenase family)